MKVHLIERRGPEMGPLTFTKEKIELNKEFLISFRSTHIEKFVYVDGFSLSNPYVCVLMSKPLSKRLSRRVVEGDEKLLERLSMFERIYTRKIFLDGLQGFLSPYLILSNNSLEQVKLTIIFYAKGITFVTDKEAIEKVYNDIKEALLTLLTTDT